MEKMFHGCSSLKDLNISNFKFNRYINVKNMFSLCSEELKNEIKKNNLNLKELAFDDTKEEQNFSFEDSEDDEDNEGSESDN